MNNQDIIQALHDYFAGNTTLAQEHELAQALGNALDLPSQAQADAAMFMRIYHGTASLAQDASTGASEQEAEALFNCITSTKTRLRWWPYAAAAVLLAAIAGSAVHLLAPRHHNAAPASVPITASTYNTPARAHDKASNPKLPQPKPASKAVMTSALKLQHKAISSVRPIATQVTAQADSNATHEQQLLAKASSNKQPAATMHLRGTASPPSNQDRDASLGSKYGHIGTILSLMQGNGAYVHEEYTGIDNYKQFIVLDPQASDAANIAATIVNFDNNGNLLQVQLSGQFSKKQLEDYCYALGSELIIQKSK